MSLATASCDLWQNEQRSTSSEPVLVLTEQLLQLARCLPELRIPSCISRTPNPGRSRAAPVRSLPRSAIWRVISRTFQCHCTVKPFNHNFDALHSDVSAIYIQLLKHYLCLKIISSIMPYSLPCCAFMMKSRSTSLSTFSSLWPLCLESNWLVISRMRRISRA